MRPPFLLYNRIADYGAFMFVEIVLRFVFRFFPITVAPAITEMEINPAIKPYSMAVAPDLSFKKRFIMRTETNILSP